MKDKDYTISYESNINAGMGIVNGTGKALTPAATVKLGGKTQRKTVWESSNFRVAKVNSNGITAVGKGTCYVYAYAQSGIFAKIKVTVK